MKRKAQLAGHWYPDDYEEIKKLLEVWTQDIAPDKNHAAAIVPHAGWYYSGEVAARAIKTLTGKDLYIVAGGHLAPGNTPLAIEEELIETPAGTVRNRTDMISEIKNVSEIKNDVYIDNTIEVILPMIKYFYPESEVLCLRLPPDEKAILIAEVLYNLTKDKIETGFIGSTDLTHYGASFGFNPAGDGHAAFKWVKETNDKEIISLLLENEVERAVKHANKNKSACSIGAAAAAAKYAELNEKKGSLQLYRNSFEVKTSDSFVGYAGIIY